VAKKAVKTGMATTESADLALIRKLADMLNSTGLTEIELEQGTSRIRVAKSNTTTATTYVAGPAPQSSAASPAHSPATATPVADRPGALKSPMVGTAYLCPSPGAAQFVSLGDAVKQGQTVLIIEAMKTMNQIHAHVSGTIREIRIENGQPVEYGEVLLVIE
jgi:acetyl-CoA carboxylase biotin carboxyl carrier protein